MRGAWQTAVPTDQLLPAPTTGVFLGSNKGGPVSLRMFRQRGLRIVVFTHPHIAQILTLRAAVSGAAVRVMTHRHAIWTPVLRHGVDAQLAPASGHLPPVQHGPALFVEDLPDEQRLTGEPGDWQCLLHVRTLDEHRQQLPRLSNLSQVDVAFFGMLSRPLAAEVGQMFGLGDAAASLTVVPPHAVAAVARGRVQLVRPELSSSERAALQGAGDQPLT